MPNVTKIGWTDFSSNPLRYRNRATGADEWFCIPDDEDCARCYASQMAVDFKRGGAFSAARRDTVEPYLHAGELRALATDLRLSGQRCLVGDRGDRVFVGDMTDLFGDWVPDDLVLGLFEVLARRRDVQFQILTKRSQRMAAFGQRYGWPDNVWAGTSAGMQRGADRRVPHLLRVPARIRFLSVEPLIGVVDVSPWLHGIDWVIVGGESGPRHRPMDLRWLSSVVEQCLRVGLPAFVKQDAGRYPGKQGRIPDHLWRLKAWPDAPAATAPGPASDERRRAAAGR